MGALVAVLQAKRPALVRVTPEEDGRTVRLFVEELVPGAPQVRAEFFLDQFPELLLNWPKL
jgi:hypothetical protein